MTTSAATDWSRAVLPTRLPPPSRRLLPLWEEAPTLPPAWLDALTPRQALCLLVVDRTGARYEWLARGIGCSVAEVATAVAEAREALTIRPVHGSLTAQGRRRRAASHTAAGPASLLRGLLGPAVWVMALALVGAAVAVLLALAVLGTLDATVEMAEAGRQVLGGGGL